MKRFLAIVMAALMLVSLSAFAFAEPSPTEQKVYIVEYIDYYTDPAEDTIYTVPVGDTISFTAKGPDREFIQFDLQGEYELVSARRGPAVLTEKSITIRPQSDMVVIATYKDVEVTTSPSDGGNNGPATGVNPWLAVGVLALAVGAVGVILTTKRLVGKKNG